MSLARDEALFKATDASPVSKPREAWESADDIYGKYVFTLDMMRKRLPKEVYKELESIVNKGGRLNPEIADVVASAMKDWAIEMGATHYTHWFQPMTGLTAEKHDAFISPTGPGKAISEFSGKTLISGEPDASSFPSGGIRSTFEARGYTAWDPTVPVFIIPGPYSSTLHIPTFFYSYSGEALDRKIPLMRSISALSRQALRILRLFGNTTATSVRPQVGPEQEYFLVDKNLAALRPDLMLCGRTLVGAPSPKGQELEDHYFGSIPSRVMSFMEDVEDELLKLGIPAKTRHNEVAPGQFEIAPVYEEANIACDHNMLTMNMMRHLAARHGFVCLIHEKPFEGVNGSGKHNNWSMADSEGHNLLNPGSTPQDNAQFLVFLAGVLRAVHKYSIALRLGTIGAGNDHRLGANEAPPAIISVFLGEQLTDVIDSIIEGKTARSRKKPVMEIGVSSLPPLPVDLSDRNRTSPFAFTGNKFEFKEHSPVVFNGNGYSNTWPKEAERRGLPNLSNTVDALEHYSDPDVMNVFLRHGILSEREILSRQEILLDTYAKDIEIEGATLLDLVRGKVLPPCRAAQAQACDLVLKTKKAGIEPDEEMKNLQTIRSHVTSMEKAVGQLEEAIAKVKGIEGTLERAKGARDQILPLMGKIREDSDALEAVVDDKLWELPKYSELLWVH